jgi:hypothetical protein
MSHPVAVTQMSDEVSARVAAAWAGLAGVEHLTRFQVLVRPQSLLCPPGWIGVLRIHECVTAVAPTEHLATVVTDALSDLAPEDTTSPEVIRERLPAIADVLGPAGLYYPIEPVHGGFTSPRVDVVPAAQIADLLATGPPSDVEESGLAHVTSDVSVVRDDRGDVIAACGYRTWPESIAHLGVLTRADRRSLGFGRAVAVDAIGRADSEGLLPQWRARPAASRALATAIGLREVGAQLSVRLAIA